MMRHRRNQAFMRVAAVLSVESQPPDQKARYVTVASFFLWGIGSLGGAGSGGVRWGLAGSEKVQLEKPFTSPGLHQIIRRNAQKILQTL
jgi:hypothetical protein